MQDQDPDVNSPGDGDDNYGPAPGNNPPDINDVPRRDIEREPGQMPPDVENPYPVEDPPLVDDAPLGDVDDSPKIIAGGE
jgi:hypothetical protein